MFHNTVRNSLGHPFTYYSPLSLIVLMLLYECFYAVIGGLFGYIAFRIKHRHSGFTVFFTRFFKTGGAITAVIVCYLFLRIDLVNPYDGVVMSAVPHPQAKQLIPAGLITTVANLFLPSLRAVPDRGFPQQAQQITQSNQNGQQPPTQSSGPQSQPTAVPQQTSNIPQVFIPLPTAVAKPIPVIQPNNPAPVQTAQLPSARELFNGLNTYRSQHGASQLTWDPTLGDYAAQLAEYLNRRGSIDGGQNLRQVRSQNAFAFGFESLGELQSYGVTQSATGMFSEYFGSFPSTNSTQLSNAWYYAGIGVNGTAVEIIFGARKCASTARNACQ